MPKQTYTVKQGESWASIAGRVYEDQRYFNILMEANGGGILHPGDVISIPDVNAYKSSLKKSRETHYVSPGLWNAVRQQEAALGWKSGPGNPYQVQATQQTQQQVTFPDQSTYNNPYYVPGVDYNVPAPEGSAPGAGAVTGFGQEAPEIPGPPPLTIPGENNQNNSSLNIEVPQYTTPGGRPITGQQYTQYNTSQRMNPIGPQVPTLNAPTGTGVQPGATGAQVAMMLDAPLTRQKAPGTYQAPRLSGYGWTGKQGGFQPMYNGYANTPVSGYKPGSYLLFDRINAALGLPWKQIGGSTEEGYPDLALPWNEWAGKRVSYLSPDNLPGGAGVSYGSGYVPGGGGGGGGYSPGGYGPSPRVQPGLNIRAGRSYVPSNYTPFPFFGNSGVRRAGVQEARSAGVVALTSWTL